MSQEGKSVMVQGRIVWLSGNTVFTGSQKKDQSGRLITNDKGEPVMQYGFGLAVPKPAPDSKPEAVKNFMDLWDGMHLEAASLYPNAGGQIPPGFSMKYKDGDGLDHNGNPFRLRKGYEGCLVFALTTSLPLKFFKFQGAYVQVNSGIKCGDYVQVQVNVRAHAPKPGTQAKPGLYLNPGLTLLLAEGEEIVNSPDASVVFGNQAPKPVFDVPAYQAPASFAGLAMPAAPAQPPQPWGAPAMPVAPAQPPAWNGQPNMGVIPQAFQQAPAMPVAPAQPPQPWGAPAMPAAPAQPPAWNPGNFQQ